MKLSNLTIFCVLTILLSSCAHVVVWRPADALGLGLFGLALVVCLVLYVRAWLKDVFRKWRKK